MQQLLELQQAAAAGPFRLGTVLDQQWDEVYLSTLEAALRSYSIDPYLGSTAAPLVRLEPVEAPHLVERHHEELGPYLGKQLVGHEGCSLAVLLGSMVLRAVDPVERLLQAWAVGLHKPDCAEQQQHFARSELVGSSRLMCLQFQLLQNVPRCRHQEAG